MVLWGKAGKGGGGRKKGEEGDGGEELESNMQFGREKS